MKGHVADLRNPASDSLAAVHYKNRYIQTDQCYTCHSDYGMFGTMSAKLDGLGHVYHNITGNYRNPSRSANPYSNLRCLSCHGGAQNFVAKHEKDMMPSLHDGNENSCLDCHGPAHKPEVPAPRSRRSRRCDERSTEGRRARDAASSARRSATLLAVILAFALLIRRWPYVFTVFMFLGPAAPRRGRRAPGPEHS